MLTIEMRGAVPKMLSFKGSAGSHSTYGTVVITVFTQ
jgi:hypothetical protein